MVSQRRRTWWTTSMTIYSRSCSSGTLASTSPTSSSDSPATKINHAFFPLPICAAPPSPLPPSVSSLKSCGLSKTRSTTSPRARPCAHLLPQWFRLGPFVGLTASSYRRATNSVAMGACMVQRTEVVQEPHATMQLHKETKDMEGWFPCLIIDY